MTNKRNKRSKANKKTEEGQEGSATTTESLVGDIAKEFADLGIDRSLLLIKDIDFFFINIYRINTKLSNHYYLKVNKYIISS